MGFISRKLFPACESMCVCCPALRSRSRQPVKRYKKLLAEIFPKSLDSAPNERKIVKLCEYAAKNPFRIPKITKYLEERCYKELRNDHIKFIYIVVEAYNKLLCICKEQMVYFAISLLNVASELLDKSKQDASLILGCQTLTSFIYSQADGTYTHNIENFVHKVCKLAHADGDQQGRSLKASSLQCLSAMVWFMAKVSYIFAAFDEIVHVILDNYGTDIHDENVDGREELHHIWLDVVRSESRVAGADTNSSFMIRPRPEKKDSAMLTREEIDSPRVWAQVCIQRMVELAEESTTMRRVLDPMFLYFDSGRHWVPRHGLAVAVLSDMSYLLGSSGHQQLVLAAIVRHLDHKNISHDPQLKCHVLQVAAALTRQIRLEAVLSDIGYVSDLCRHLRKSLQATVESVGEREANLNFLLQKSIEDCLLEIAKGIVDARPLFDMMALTLEKVPSGVVGHATIGSLVILAHTICSASLSSRSQQFFPEALLDQLLKVMLHPDVMVRVGAHQIFSVLLFPSSNDLPHGVSSPQRKWRSDTASTSASIAALLEKLRREKDSANIENHGNNGYEDHRERDILEDEWKQGHPRKNSPSFYKISSIIDRTAGTTSLAEVEPYIMMFSEDQITQLLSAFWLQATLPDNTPSNIEAIAHSFMLTVISSRLKISSNSLVVRFFQLPLSLRSLVLDPNSGMLAPACQRSILILSTGMLMSAAKIYQVSELIDLLKSFVVSDVDPFLGISDELEVHVKSQVDVREYGSVSDNQQASSLLFELQGKVLELNKVILDILIQNLSAVTELSMDDLTMQLSEVFTPDEAFMFGPHSLLDMNHSHMVSYSKESLSFEEDATTSSLVEDDAMSEASVADMTRFIPKMPTSPTVSHVVSIGQLLESALEVAGQVAGTSVSTSPLPYDTMTKHCEALGTGTRKKLSNWLIQENQYSRAGLETLPSFPAFGCQAPWKISSDSEDVQGAVMKPIDSCLAMRLPPASPFDNFLKAAGC